MGNPLIVTGFYASKENYAKKREFLELWIRNTGNYDIVIIDNNEVLPLKVEQERIRVVRINGNIGAWDAFLGKSIPYFCGWSVSWIIGDLIAYSEGRDMLYKEQDCLWFGDCVGRVYKDFNDNLDMVMQLGFCPGAPCCVESALFWVRNEYLIELIGKYYGVPHGDGIVLVEEKLHQVSLQDKRIVPLTFRIGRDRPMPVKDECWYIQKTTEKDLRKLRALKLI